MVSVMGLDISQTSTGIAKITDSGGMWVASAGLAGRANDGLQARSDRLDKTKAMVLEYFPSADPCEVLVEDLMMPSGTGNKLDRSALWWFVVNGIIRRGYTVSVASPGTLKKWATGKGTADKVMVGLFIGRLVPDLEFSNDDELDAFTAAHLLAVRAGLPVVTRAHHVAANWKSIHWPLVLTS